MAQRKPPSSGKPAAKKGPTRPGGKPAGGSSATTKPAANVGTGRPSAPRKAPPRKPGKSIVNQKQTPWGIIASTAAVVVFAAAVIVIVIATHKSKPQANGGCSDMIGSNATTYLNELKCAKDIQGVTFHQEPNRTHVTTAVKYDTTPPVGGNHSAYWADCTGTVYANAIANENAVHDLEHGAVWITYRPGLSTSQLDTLTGIVSGNDHVLLSPYPNLKTPISLQSWGYQLFLQKASDPRIQKFITALKTNPKTTPEYGGSCSQPTFLDHPSTFGHPLFQPVTSTTAPSVAGQ